MKIYDLNHQFSNYVLSTSESMLDVHKNIKNSDILIIILNVVIYVESVVFLQVCQHPTCSILLNGLS